MIDAERLDVIRRRLDRARSEGLFPEDGYWLLARVEELEQVLRDIFALLDRGKREAPWGADDLDFATACLMAKAVFYRDFPAALGGTDD